MKKIIQIILQGIQINFSWSDFFFFLRYRTSLKILNKDYYLPDILLHVQMLSWIFQATYYCFVFNTCFERSFRGMNSYASKTIFFPEEKYHFDMNQPQWKPKSLYQWADYEQ